VCTMCGSTIDWVDPDKLGAPFRVLTHMGRVGLVDVRGGVDVRVGSCTLPGGMSQGC
jgi:hypothetical protein